MDYRVNKLPKTRGMSRSQLIMYDYKVELYAKSKDLH